MVARIRISRQNTVGTLVNNPAPPLSSQLVLDRRDFLESDAQPRKNVRIVDRVDEDKLRLRIAAAFKNSAGMLPQKQEL